MQIGQGSKARQTTGGKRAAAFLAVTSLFLGIMAPVAAHAALTVTPLSWNMIGLDSNSPATGPRYFPVGARVCSDTATTSVAVNFLWDSSNANVNLRAGSASSTSISSLGAGACQDTYFEVEINQVAGAYDTARRYHITATDASGTASSPTPRELYVEHLISQNRNSVTGVKLNGVSIPAGGTMDLMVGNTYTIELDGGTATQGYNQFEAFINFPNTIFEILSVNTTYSADNSPYVPTPSSKLYADACGWENDPASPNYQSCVGGDYKAGGTNVVTTYTVKIIGGGGSSQTLNTLLYDFSGSSFHYNSDFSTGAYVANIIGPSSITLGKQFVPDAIAPAGTSTLTFTITNPTTSTMGGVNFTDPLPSGVTVAATPGASVTGCGSPTFAPVASDTALTFSNATLAPNSSCIVKVNVTAGSTGTFVNTTGHLFINGTTDTGNSATATLTSQTASSCVAGQTLAHWTVPSTATNPPDTTGGLATTIAANVSSAVASLNPTVSTNTAINTTTGSNDSYSWASWGYKTKGQYVDFVVDTRHYSGVSMVFHAKTDSNGPTSMVVSYDSGSGITTQSTYTSPTITTTWNPYTVDFTGLTSTSGNTTFRVSASGATNDNSGADLYLDDIQFIGCSAASPAPTLAKAFASGSVPVGSPVTLTFTIANTQSANVALTNVQFTDPLPGGMQVAPVPAAATSGAGCTGISFAPVAGTSLISYSAANMAAGATCTASVQVVATQAGQFDNVSGYIASTESGSNKTANGYATASLTAVAAPILAKSFSASPILTGNGSTLSFTITNPNQATTLTGIAFSDVLPSGLSVADASSSLCGGTLTSTAASGTIALAGGSLAGASSCTFSVAVTSVAAGIKNNVTGNVTSNEGGTGNTASATLVVRDMAPAISLIKQVGPTASGPWTSFSAVTPPLPQNVYFRFGVENTGDAALTSVSISDPAIPGLDLSACTSALAGGLALYDFVTCVSGPTSVSTAGAFTNTATAQGSYSSTAYTSPSATASYATTGLSIVKSATESSFSAAGDTLHYSYVVTNDGFAPLAGPVTVADDKTTVSCPAVTTVGNFDDYLNPGESITCSASYTVQSADVTAGFVTNNAAATAGGVTSPSTSKTVSMNQPDLHIVKTHSGNFVQGQTGASYTLTVSNVGTGPSTGTVSVVDTLPSGLTATAISGTGWTCVLGTLTCTRNDVLAASASYPAITVTVNVAASAAATITNTAVVSGGGDGSPGNNTASDVTNVQSVLPPSAANDRTTTNLNTPVKIAAILNDTAGAGTSLDAASIDLDLSVAGRQTSITIAGEGTFDASANDGSVTFTPATGFQGVATVPYVIKDALGQTSNIADITVTVNDTSASANPVANDDFGTTPLNTLVTLSATGNDVPGTGNTLTASSVALSGGNVAQGTWANNGDGTVTFTPASGFTGTATVNYTVKDSANGTSNSATITVLVTGGATPAARDDSGATQPSVPVTLTIVNNDLPGSGNTLAPATIDLDTGTPAVDAGPIVVPNVGSWQSNGDGTVTFTPQAGFTGTATRTYTIQDSGSGLSNIATITIDVLPSSAPTAVNDTANTAFNTPVNLSPASNDSASAGAVLNAATVDLDTVTPGVQRALVTTADGTWQVVDNAGTVTFTPATGFTGTTAAFPYAISDSLGHTATATMQVTVGAASASDMTVTLTGFPAATSPGATVTGTVTCVNNGPGQATNANCGASGLPAGATVTCTPTSPQATLAASASMACSVSFTAPSTGTVDFTGTTLADNESNTANNSANGSVAVIDAVDDGSVSIGAGGGTVSVLANDTIGGAAVGIATTISAPTIQNDGGLTGLSVNGSGALVVPANTTPATYTVTYRICALNPVTACDTATVQIVVSAALLPDLTVTKTHSGSFTQGQSGATYTLTVSNTGTGATDGSAVVVTDTLPAGLTATAMSGSGWTCTLASTSCTRSDVLAAGASYPPVTVTVDVASNAAASITNAATVSGGGDSNGGNNNAADPTVISPASPISNGRIAGSIWFDLNGNHRHEANEPPRVGWQVELLKNGSVIAVTTTDGAGAYVFNGLGAGTYTVRFINPNGALTGGPTPVNGEDGVPVAGGGTPSLCQLSNIVLNGSVTAVAGQSLPIDPSGVVYSSVARVPLGGATVTLMYGGSPVNPAFVAGGSASMVTAADGYYGFFLLPGAPAGTYSLAVTATGYTFASLTIPALAAPAGFAGGPVTSVTGAPAVGQDTTYYLSFPKPTVDITNDNIPLDPVGGAGGGAGSIKDIPVLAAWQILALIALLGLMAARGPRRGHAA